MNEESCEQKRVTALTRERAWEMLTRYNKDEFHLRHAETVEKTMRYFARKLGFGSEEDYWGIVGLLHDIDFEQWPQEHCVKSQALLKDLGIDDSINRAVASHGYAICTDIKPEHLMEKILYATDELTGLLGAVVLMYPSKSAQDLNLKSVKKKFKDKKFAAGCSREVIERGAEMLGWTLEELIERTIAAYQSFEK
jgi:predicted hydrolase (HD superfamily)